MAAINLKHRLTIHMQKKRIVVIRSAAAGFCFENFVAFVPTACFGFWQGWGGFKEKSILGRFFFFLYFP